MKHRLPPRALSTEAPAKKEASPSTECISPFKDAPWEYLETEEYLARYGSRPVWANYRRNHKGGIPPQRTRKTCIRGDKVAGNPCPICRDQKLHVDYRNVKLLEQFICEHTGVIFHAPHTGVCMKQHKKLTQAIKQARDHGLLPFHVPVADLRDTDFSNQHGAVTRTPPGPALGGGAPPGTPGTPGTIRPTKRWPGCAGCTAAICGRRADLRPRGCPRSPSPLPPPSWGTRNPGAQEPSRGSRRRRQRPPPRPRHTRPARPSLPLSLTRVLTGYGTLYSAPWGEP
uniref:Small ribosomal subunit protein mS40 n=1 Tax=Ornithorhynchus anatinus TaxID=9258 RepID=A0A6I8NFH8_ORNAN